MNESSNLDAFLANWQEVGTVDLDAIWEVRQTNDPQTDMFFPTSFFEASPTRRSIPLSIRPNRKETEHYLTCFCAILPANTEDLLWLIDRFLAGRYPNRCELDLAARLEVGTSVYRDIAAFCPKEIYKTHSCHRTMLALMKIVEQSQDGRMLVANTLFCACSVLQEPCEEKEERGAFEVGGETRWILRFGLVVRPTTLRGVSAREEGSCCSL